MGTSAASSLTDQERALLIRVARCPLIRVALSDARNSPPGWQRLPDGRPEALGAALIAWMERLGPSWPTAASTTVACNGATMLIYPVRGGWSGAPIAQKPAGAPPAAVGSAVLAALAVSGAASEVPSQQELARFRAALRETGWTNGGLDAAPQVSIRRTPTGDLFISRVGTAAEIPVAGRGAEAVGNAVLAQLPVADTAPIPPDRQPASFGPKTGWIAVRGVPGRGGRGGARAPRCPPRILG